MHPDPWGTLCIALPTPRGNANPGPTTVPVPRCPQSAANFFEEFVNNALVLGRGPEGGSDCHVNAQIPFLGGGDIINFHIKFNTSTALYFAVVTGRIGDSLVPNIVQLGDSAAGAALAVVTDLAGILGVTQNVGGFDAVVQLFGRLLPRLTGALEQLAVVT